MFKGGGKDNLYRVFRLRPLVHADPWGIPNRTMAYEIERQIRDWLDTLEVGVLLLDAEGKILTANTFAANWYASRKIDYKGREFAELFRESERKGISKSVRRALNGESVNAETELLEVGEGMSKSVLLRFTPRKSQEGGEVSILILAVESPELAQARREIKNLIDRSKELERLVVTCPVTGIYNRRFFDMRFEEELTRAERYKHTLGIGILDLDGFKPVNDQFGHPVGDAVLKQTADTLRKSIRGCDIVARIGGDEFALLVPEVSPEKLLPMAIRIRQNIQSNRVSTDLGHVGVTASIGLACYTPEEGEVDHEEPLRRADEALLRAKDQGGNRIILYGHESE